MMTETTYTPLITGVVHICGPHDVGKTTLAFECGADPARMCFVDSDVKGRATVDQIRADHGDLGMYVDFTTETAGMTQLQVFDHGKDFIGNRIKADTFDVVIWDTWTGYASVMKPFVRANRHLFRHPKDWAPKGSMAGGQEWKEAQGMEAEHIAILQSKVPLVILVTHLKDQYVDNRKTGKQIPAASRTINRVPNLRLWLLRNPTGNVVPIGLVRKRLDKKVLVPGKGLRTVSLLPEKLVPNIQLPEEEKECIDQSLWDTISRYLTYPFGLRAPLPAELPDAFERSIIDGTMTEDQRRMYLLRLQAAAANGGDLGEEGEVADVSIKAFIAELRENGADDAAIARSLKAEEDLSYKEIADALGNKVGQVRKWIKEGE